VAEFGGGVSKLDTPPFVSGDQPSAEVALRQARWISALVVLVAVWAVTLLPLRVVGIGFRPIDDARRHVAKVIADKPWEEILVLRPEVTVDPHPGWHALLGAARDLGLASQMALFVLPIVGLGALFLALPLLQGTVRPEPWLTVLLATALASPTFFNRIFIGRPFLVTMCVLLAVCARWQRLRAERLPVGTWATLAALFALSVWIHGNWYLWALPLAVFLLAGETRVTLRLSTALGLGTLIGAAATGAPIAFLSQTLHHPLWALTTDLPKRVLVGEFQPSSGEPMFVAVVLAVVAWRAQRGRAVAELRRDPLFVLTVCCWVLGFHTQRFWWDWGMPAGLVWMARELDGPFAAISKRPRQRLLLTSLLAAVLFLAVTNDRDSRWSRSERSPFLSLDKPAHREWLPAPGGILYSNSMRVFYNTFWKNPNAPWRYMVGFEPALMPPADLAIFRRIQLEHSSDAAFAPWVEKMRPQDRLVIVRSLSEAPRIARLEWHSPYRGMWIGRLPASGSPAAPSRSPQAVAGEEAIAVPEGEEPAADR
jgi:hypothetical protein